MTPVNQNSNNRASSPPLVHAHVSQSLPNVHVTSGLNATTNASASANVSPIVAHTIEPITPLRYIFYELLNNSWWLVCVCLHALFLLVSGSVCTC